MNLFSALPDVVGMEILSSLSDVKSVAELLCDVQQ
jgi:hypothetical protein